MDDPDALGGVFTHWIVFDIPITMNRIKQGAKLPKGLVELTNDFGRQGYGGPCPPRGTHRYIFTLYALDAEKFDGTQSNYKSFLSKHTIAKTQLMCLYNRKS
jgi:Raf kinase inhibitor-like YbhB/YbcL family protein